MDSMDDKFEETRYERSVNKTLLLLYLKTFIRININ